MRKVRFLLVFLVIAALAVPGISNTALADDRVNPEQFIGHTFLAVLLGQNEVPPVETGAQGASLIALNPNETALWYTVAVTNIENVIAAHIHCGPPGVNGPVTVDLYPTNAYFAEPAIDGNFLVVGSATEEDVHTLPDSPECPGGIDSFADVVEKMLAGQTYVNVHTEQNPGGEARGQLILIR